MESLFLYSKSDLFIKQQCQRSIIGRVDGHTELDTIKHKVLKCLYLTYKHEHFLSCTFNLLNEPPVYVLLWFSTVERYNPQENRWHTVSPMGTRRKHLGCAVYQDMIYSVGGRDDTTELSSAERYNPRTNQWSPVVAMTSRRSGVSMCVCM